MMNLSSSPPSRPHRLGALSILVVAVACGSGCMGGDDESATGEGRQDAVDLGARTAYTLWVHGMNAGAKTTIGRYDDFSYWGPADVAAGVNKKAVNWDGVGRISESNEPIRNALDCFCTGANFCYVVAHGAGDLQIGYALDHFGSSPREIKNASPGEGGACQGDGRIQTGWNIKWVDVAAGAAGGTEAADRWSGESPLGLDLHTASARTLYDHNNTQGVQFNLFAGGKPGLLSTLVRGRDDALVPYHSSGGLADAGDFCNPGDRWCEGELNLGDQGTLKKSAVVAKWANHYTRFRDDNAEFDHDAQRAWAGIVSVAIHDVVQNAR